MEYRISETPAFKIIGKGISVTTQDGENFKRIPAFWEECSRNGLCCQLETLAEKASLTCASLLGVCMDYDHDLKELTYFIGVESAKADHPDQLEEREIPASTWAVFESIGPTPDAIQSVIKRIYAEWFPATDFIHTGGPEMEVYLPGDPNDPNYRCEVWVPIKKLK